MKQGYTIEITNCTDRDLTWTEYQSAMSAARTLDAAHTHDNPLMTETTVKTKINHVQNRLDLVHVCIMDLNPAVTP